MPVPTANKAPSFFMLFFLDLREFRTTDGEHGTNLAGRGSLVRLILALVITANYAEYHWTRGLK
jgi:hypothetical protein